MQDLRLIERRDHTLILETEDGSEYVLEVTDEVIATVQSIHRSQQSQTSETKVRPREVQSLLREGVARDEVASRLGIDRDDVDRYAGPIEAEFAFILEQALGVQVRADTNADDTPQFFGEVIEERLGSLGTHSHVWSTWRDPEEGWMVLLTFMSHEVEHEAKWAFEHKKRLLSPITADAVNLSKQGDVGDKLIPTLRAVDRPEEPQTFDAEPFDQAALSVPDHDDEPDALPHFAQSDFERRLGIEHRAIATEPEPQDLGQTSDLLDALRKRRETRESGPSEDEQTQAPEAAPTDEPLHFSSHDDGGAKPPMNIWAPPPTPDAPEDGAPSNEARDVVGEREEPADPGPAEPPASTDKKAKKGRQSVPSWDEILFGTRSDDD